MKIIQKILLVLIIAMTVFIIMPQNVFASKVEEAIGKVDASNVKVEGEDDFAGVVSNILAFLQVASGLVAVIMIAYTGFRYIVETPEMKEKLKKDMIPIVVGILLVFFATSIANFFVGIFANN